MTMTITLAGDGVDFNAALETFFDDFAPYELPLFLPETGASQQIVHLDTPTPGAEAETRTVVLGGEDFGYTMSNHSVSGTIETITLGTLGSAYDAEAGDLVVDETGLVAIDALITFSDLDVENAAGVKGEVHEIVKGLMGGGLDGSTVDTGPLLDLVWGEGHDLYATAGDDSYSGTRFDDTVRGYAGDDVIRGNGGDDTLLGGAGNDTLLGGNGSDTLNGGAGRDTLAGGAGKDRLIGGGGNDQLNGGGGKDVLSGKGGADILLGGGGNDRLNGGAGADTLDGGKGADRLTGGAGADTFVFAAAKQADGDVITDFSSRQGDVIDLSGIDADSNSAGDQAFTLIGDSDFSGSAGELRAWESGGKTLIAGDTDGDGLADFQITLLGGVDLDAGDFLF